METIKSLLGLIKGTYNNALDRADIIHLQILNRVWMAFFAVVPGGILLAFWASHDGYGWVRTIIALLMLLVLVLGFSAFTKPSTIASVGVLGAAVGVPVEGKAVNIALGVLKQYARATGLILVWMEFFLLVLLVFPWMVGSFSAAIVVLCSMITLTLVVIYALIAGKMEDGAWHKPVIATTILILLMGIGMGMPKQWFASMGLPVSAESSSASKAAFDLAQESANKADELQAECVARLKKDGKLYTYGEIRDLCPSVLSASKTNSTTQGVILGISALTLLHIIGAIVIAGGLGAMGYKLVKKKDDGKKDAKKDTKSSYNISALIINGATVGLVFMLINYIWHPDFLKPLNDKWDQLWSNVETKLPTAAASNSRVDTSLIGAYVVAPKEHPYYGMRLAVAQNGGNLAITGSDGDYLLKEDGCAPPKEYEDGRVYSSCTGTWSKGVRTGSYQLFAQNSSPKMAILDSDAGKIEMEFKQQ